MSLSLENLQQEKLLLNKIKEEYLISDQTSNIMRKHIIHPVYSGKDTNSSLPQLAEVGVNLWGYKDVCEILQIEKFADLKPLNAHRYLAYLAREEIIAEIITTNYDCCIEKAFMESFGYEKRLNGALAVIHNPIEYTSVVGHK